MEDDKEQSVGDESTPRGRYRNRFLESALNQPVVVVERNNCIIRGILAEYGRHRLTLTAASIQHRKAVDVPWVNIERAQVSHIHPDVKAREEGSRRLDSDPCRQPRPTDDCQRDRHE